MKIKNELQHLNIEELTLYNYLVEFCNKNYKVKRCKYFDDGIYCLLPSEDINEKLSLDFKEQNTLLEKLENAKLIKIQLENNDKKYILIL